MKGESGIDAGGPARELVAECALDLCCPSCGLVIPVPNARNDVGGMREMVIPYPDPRHTDVARQFEFAGALIAIAIRTGLVQDFCFPPLVWHYLCAGEVVLDALFEIDQNYKSLIQSLQETMQSGMTEGEFANRFQLKFVITDSAGNDVQLTQRGRSEAVTLVNCGQFISLANQFRLNELVQSLDSIRHGLWTNFNFEAPKNLEWRVLEFCACGSKDIDVEVLKSVTQFRLIVDAGARIAMFWTVIHALTFEERTALLKFATGRARLPPMLESGEDYLVVDEGWTFDKLPQSSTCFHQLHLPIYTSYAKALQSIRVAVSFTGTFECG
jgi:hypothetical protein